MKKNFTLFALLSLLIWVPMRASHEMGVQISYGCLNSCTTRVYFKGYRDCTGISTIHNNVNWVSPPGCTAPPALGAWSSVTTVEVTPVCPGAPTGCTVPGSPVNGVQELSSYRDYNTCGGTPCTYTLTWADCCRNGSITSLNNGGSQGIALNSTTINTALGSCNSSPVYTNYPLFYLCAGQNYTVHQGAVDPDHDSLSYSMGSCYQTGTTQVSYAPGYSAMAPLGPSWNVNLDGSSGIVTLAANPGNIGVGVICINVQEYRGGQLIGTTQRDIQVTVVNCGANNNPTIGNITNLTAPAASYLTHVYADPGVPLCFDLPTADADAGQNMRLFWSNPDGTSATFASASNGSILDTVPGTGANPPVGRFCWSSPSYGTYHFKFRVEDSNCPIYGFSERFVVVHVNPCNTGPTVTMTQMACPTVAFNATSCFMGFSQFQWTGTGGFVSNQQNPVFTYPAAGNYTWQLINTNGLLSDTVSGSVQVGGGAPVWQNLLTGPYNISPCGNQFSDTLDPGPGLGFAWSNNSAAQQQIITYPGIYYVTVTGLNGCETWDSATVSYTAPDIEGQLQTSTGAAMQNQRVLLIKHDTTTQSLWAVDSVWTDNNGYYFFCNVTDTLTFLKATPLVADYPGEMPTYADTTLFWNNAIAFNGVLQAPFQHNFKTLAGSNPGGPGFIGGLISQGANKMNALGDPVIGLQVFLRDRATGDVLGYRYTDANGYFSFAAIPLGDYEIVPDKPLVSISNVPQVSIDAQTPVRDSLDFQLHHYWLELVSSGVGLPQPMAGLSFAAMPNPFGNTTRLALDLPADANVTIDLFDMVGKRMQGVYAGELQAGKYRYELGKDLTAGIYFVRLQINGAERVLKIMKRD